MNGAFPRRAGRLRTTLGLRAGVGCDALATLVLSWPQTLERQSIQEIDQPTTMIEPRPLSLRRPPLHVFAWYAVNLALLLSVMLLIAGVAWEYSTDRYLQGFANAIVPLQAAPIQKAEAILTWMRDGPPRLPGTDVSLISDRDPEGILNHSELLSVCGTATNAFVNLAATAGLQARRLLLLDGQAGTKHVVAELRVRDRWVVVDPTTRNMLRNSAGALLTVPELQNAGVFGEMLARTPGYAPSWSFERPTYLRLERVPYLGPVVRRVLDWASPGWEQWVNWASLVERPSFALFLPGGLGLILSALSRWAMGWYCETVLGLQRVRLRDRFAIMAFAFINGRK